MIYVIDPKEFSDTFMKNYNKNIEEFEKATEGLVITPHERRNIPIG